MNKLPKELKNLVNLSIESLGNNIKLTYGVKSYQKIEAVRKKMKISRSLNKQDFHQLMLRTFKNFETLSQEELFRMAHSFSVYMELINRCESAYRHYRLKGTQQKDDHSKRPYSIIFVFTAHPTEARSDSAVALFDQIEDILKQILFTPSKEEIYLKALSHLMNLLLQIPISGQIKPTVEKESQNIFNAILSNKILQEQIDLKKKNINIQFRSWVGGDKDGHPNVDYKTMLISWSQSRYKFVHYITDQFEQHCNILIKLPQTKEIKTLLKETIQLQKKFLKIISIKNNDSAKVTNLRKEFEQHCNIYNRKMGLQSPQLENISTLFWLYPALVVPLEIREDAELVHKALTNTKEPIFKMLKQLSKVSQKKLTKWYVRGFIISMVQTSGDYLAGVQLVKKTLGTYEIPVVPLFETRAALENSNKILKDAFLKSRSLKSIHTKKWGGRFEIMLGYSDSSKESGVFTSRLLIAKTIKKLDSFFRAHQLIPVFFHGSGGSIARGGGSIKEQTGWWPQTALNIYKSTIQGEMIYRGFNDPLIMESQVQKILKNYSEFKFTKSYYNEKLVLEFANSTQKYYQDFLKNKDFVHFVSSVTPYSYLDQLKIGSRPSKRQSSTKDFKLRAIPWVLCWTQTRILFPVWWGVGSSWQALSLQEKAKLKSYFKKDDFLKTYLKTLGFTLSKVELSMFNIYLTKNLPPEEAKKYHSMFKQELSLAIRFVREISGETNLLWFRPWLKESIYYRSSMIHPLNLIQILALQRKDYYLLRETVSGIACGMMTTG